jgi:hypothetical protein
LDIGKSKFNDGICGKTSKETVELGRYFRESKFDDGICGKTSKETVGLAYDFKEYVHQSVQ